MPKTPTTPLALPIDALLAEIVAALRAGPALVVEAPPGAGKTTRVPRALLEAGVAGDGEVVVLQPRRLPARLAAARVAEEMGEPVGGRVGYTVRFDDVSGSRTRLRFVTEGVLTRRLIEDPELRGAGVVVLDEFHERHIHADVALALLRRLQRGARPDLKLCVMSATLEAEPVRAYLSGPAASGDVRNAGTPGGGTRGGGASAGQPPGAGAADGCPRVRSEGRLFDVAVEFLAQPDDRPLAVQVTGAVRRVLREEPTGDLLVFLPGAAEIRRAREALESAPGFGAVVVVPLHGDLAPAEQTRAVRPDPEGRRKVILSTNVAETSVTIDGVVAVVDAGLARVASHSPWTGLPTLAVQKISQASAAQRAGRAGRTRPGRCLRLYTRHDFDGRRRHDPPEIARLDLAETVLSLAAAGVDDASAFPWFEAPPAPALAAARELLARLGAVDAGGRLSDVGRRMLRFPLHPRLARVVVEGERRGVGADAALVAALVAERDIRERARAHFGATGGGGRGGAAGGPGGHADGAEVLELVELFEAARAARFSRDRLRALALDGRAVEAVEQARRQLATRARDEKPRPPTRETVDEALALAVLTGFPDRVGKRRTPGGAEVAFAAGGAAALSPSQTGELVVAVDVEERSRGGRAAGVSVRLSSPVRAEWLLDLYPDALAATDELTWNAEREQVERTSRLAYGALALEESRTPAPPSDEAATVLADAALAAGLGTLCDAETLAALGARLAFLHQIHPDADVPVLGDAELGEAVRAVCAGRRSFAELRQADLPSLMQAGLPGDVQRLLRTDAPERVSLPGGRAVRVHYEADKPPWIESRLQDFFGMGHGPTVAGGRVPLTLHLLAPNGRAVQVTRDLASFWTQHYPALRRELGRRYPRHAWPEDGRTATPPPPKPARSHR